MNQALYLRVFGVLGTVVNWSQLIDVQVREKAQTTLTRIRLLASRKTILQKRTRSLPLIRSVLACVQSSAQCECNLQRLHVFFCCTMMLCIRRPYAVVRCLCVRASVCLSSRSCIVSSVFSPPGSHTIL